MILPSDTPIQDNSVEARTRAEKTDTLYQQGLLPVVLSVLVSGVICLVLWNVTEHARLLVWFSFATLIASLRGAIIVAYQRQSPALRAMPVWEKRFYVTSVFISLIWGLGGLFIMPPDSVVHQLYIHFILLGLVGGAVTSYAAHASMVRMLTSVTLLPVTIWFLFQNNPVFWAMSFTTIIYIAAVIRFSVTVEKALGRTIQLSTELEAYAHTVAHDLKTPLSMMLGYAGLLEADMEDKMDSAQQEHLQMIIQSSLKMTSIIDELLILASVRDMEDVLLEELDMGAIVSAAQERLLQQIKETQAEVILPDKWPVAMGYAPWVEEIWANYVSNALKYGGDAPHVVLGADLQKNGMVRFWTRDSGAGLSIEEQSRLFVPFTRLQNVAKGHGLGLSIVQRIVEKLSGEVGAESEIGAGSTFWFTLPISN